MLDVTCYGNATFSVASTEMTLLVDPYLTENEGCPWAASEVLERDRGERELTFAVRVVE